ncbi:Hpt domain-containing protein [Rhizobium sp. G187]|uniref:Hpt domain-containing protein n=1 Tax=Rhizobium sp. G187 TaxID=3451352 RepID=UPI003EE464D7
MTAALNIAFEAPDVIRAPGSGKTRPVDLIAIAVQTRGDKGAELELLQGFARQARGCLLTLSAGSSQAETRQAATRLRNSALTVGALDVVTAAELIETKGVTPDTVASVSAAVLAAEHFILKLAR